ncbi:MAG: hypothetical protein WBP29_08315 [Candidatus Zixiibacteriota bacterium]
MKAVGEKSSWTILIASGVLFVGTWVVARGLLKQSELSQPVRVILALLPIGPFAWMLWNFIKGITSLDELQRKIQLEALAVAYPVMMVFLMTLGLLDIAIGLSSENFGLKHLWYYMPVFYFLGLFVATRRYQ